MSLKGFIKEKVIMIVLIIFGIVTIEIFLMAYQFGTFIKVYIPVIIMSLLVIRSIV